MPDNPLEPGSGAELAASSAQKYPCPTCGGILNFDPKSGKLKCPYCGAEQAVPETTAEPVREHSFEGYLNRVKTQSWGLQLYSIRCDACGATTQSNDRVSAMNCPFCDHPMVVGNAPLPEDAIRPESVLPFQVDSEKLAESLRRWIRSHWFAPSDLKKFWQKGKIRSIYLPYWSFDANTHTQWSAEAGFYYYVTENNQQVKKVRWEPTSGARDDFFDDEILCASKGFSMELLRTIEPYNTKELKPYRSEYLAGHLAERYALGPKEAWEEAYTNIQAKLRGYCAGDVRGDTHRNLQIHPQFSDIKIKHTLLPLYIGHYHYKGRDFPFFANGQTGKIGGKTPLSWVKILLTILAILFVILLYGMMDQG